MTTTDSAVAPRRPPTWAVATVAGFFGLFYAYAVWNAVALLVSQATGTLGINGLGWFVLVFAAVFPMAAFAAALGLGMRRRVWQLALLLLTGLALAAVFWLNIVAYSTTAGAALVGG
ncbi:bacitracin resistance protein [Microbacterium sp.]|uniref:bacitracin resistance protein n=1 Tax=Microbacterium sp. TaxID=51671 RepID=UPI003A899AD2